MYFVLKPRSILFGYFFLYGSVTSFVKNFDIRGVSKYTKRVHRFQVFKFTKLKNSSVLVIKRIRITNNFEECIINLLPSKQCKVSVFCNLILRTDVLASKVLLYHILKYDIFITLETFCTYESLITEQLSSHATTDKHCYYG